LSENDSKAVLFSFFVRKHPKKLFYSAFLLVDHSLFKVEWGMENSNISSFFKDNANPHEHGVL
jgi:hypothetical protein